MPYPEILLAYRKVFYEGQWHLKCINCGDNPEASWDWRRTHQLYLPSGMAVITSLPPRNCETTGIPLGPAIVYDDDPVVKRMGSEDAIDAILAQNVAIIITQVNFSDIPLPLFLGEKPCTCHSFEIVVRFRSGLMSSLPEVREYKQQMDLHSSNDADLSLLYKNSTNNSRIPVGLLLPGTIVVGEATMPIAYAIKEWKSTKEATVECFGSQAFSFERNAFLIRRNPSIGNDELIGAIVEVRQVTESDISSIIL